jgi:hypothetical protein
MEGYLSSMAGFRQFSGGEASAGLQQKLQERSNCSKAEPCRLRYYSWERLGT